MQDFLACDGGFIGEERRISDEHLEENGADAPPIYRLRVASLTEYLWGDLVGCTHRRVGQLARALILDPFIVQVAIHVIGVTIINVADVVATQIFMDTFLVAWSNLNVLAQTKVAQLDVTVASDQ